MCKSMSSEGNEQCSTSSSKDRLHISDMNLDEQMSMLQEKLQRTTKFLHEIKTLSPACVEISDDLKEKQIFTRRILQVSAELQDARDVLYALCRPPRLSQRHFDLVASEGALEDPANDPSVRFFGLDWQQLFAKCFSLSLNVQIFRAQLTSGGDLDLLLLNTILRHLASIEVDVTSHGEAVLNGRLSKSQQLLIQQEQTRFNSLSPTSSCKVVKSRSFRDSNGQKKQQRQLSKYKKNKTADLNAISASCSPIEKSGSDDWQEAMNMSSAQANKRKTSFIENVSSMFKNIR